MAGGAIGSLGRHLVSSLCVRHFGTVFPYGTLFVNIIGSFLIGAIVSYFVKTLPHSIELRAFVVTGFLGGFTTFSAFSLDVINLAERGDIFSSVLYVVLSVGVSIIAVLLGVYLIKSYV